MTVLWISREGWGAAENVPRLGSIVDPAARTEVVIHHTVMIDSGDATPNVWDNFDSIAANMRRLQTIRPDLGSDIPYNAVAYVTPNGDIALCEGRGLYRSGAHTPGHNTSALGIAFAGNFEDSLAPVVMRGALISLSEWLGRLKSIGGFPNLGSHFADSSRTAFGHREFKATACPGKNLFEMLHLVNF